MVLIKTNDLSDQCLVYMLRNNPPLTRNFILYRSQLHWLSHIFFFINCFSGNFSTFFYALPKRLNQIILPNPSNHWNHLFASRKVLRSPLKKLLRWVCIRIKKWYCGLGLTPTRKKSQISYFYTTVFLSKCTIISLLKIIHQ